MCDVGAAMFAVSSALSVASAFTQNSSAVSSYDRKVEAANEEADAINKSTVFKYSMNGLQEQQVQNQEAVEEDQARTKLSEAEGEVEGGAASAGVTGNSVQQLYRSFEVATGKDISNITSNANAQIAQSEGDKKSEQMSAQNQILGLKEGLPQDPSSSIMANNVGALLNIGNSFMKDTTAVPTGAASGGLFGSGGILGTGRQFG